MASCKNWWIQNTGQVDKEGNNDMFWERDEADREYWSAVTDFVKDLDKQNDMHTAENAAHEEQSINNQNAEPNIEKPTIANMEAHAETIEKHIHEKRLKD